MFCLVHPFIYGQSFRVSGSVWDKSSRQIVKYTTIAILNADSTFSAGCVTDSTGTFSLQVVAKGNYILRANTLGYEPYEAPLAVTSSDTRIDISLVRTEIALEGVTVDGKRPLIQQKMDRYVVNVADNMLVAGKNGLSVLEFTPGLVVQNKKVSVLGEGAEIWINGRPSHMQGDVLSAYLESLRGEDIDKIEVVTAPSSEFDAGSGGRVIDIWLKKSRISDVLNGYVNAGYDRSRKGVGFGGVSLNYGTKKVSLFGNYNLRGGTDEGSLHEVTTNSQQPGEPRIFDKKLYGDTYRMLTHNIRAGADFTPTKSDIFGILFTGFISDNASHRNAMTQIDPPLDNTALSVMKARLTSRVGQFAYNANYKHLFGSEGMSLNVDANYGHNHFRNTQEQYYTFSSPTGAPSDPNSWERERSPMINRLWSAKADYEYPISETKYLKVGVKVAGIETDNGIVHELSDGNNWENDPRRSNDFEYHENIYAAYAIWRQQLNKKWGYQVGVRAEYTDWKGVQTIGNQENGRDYFKLFPTAYLQYTPNENHSIVLSYSRNIRRPDFSALNPFEIILDNYSFIRGNPDLQPSYVDNIQLSYTFKKLSTIFVYTRNNGMVIMTPVSEDNGQRIGTVFENFGNRTAYILQVGYNSMFFDFWRINLMGQFAYITNQTPDANSEFKNNGFSGVLVWGNNFQITKTFSADLGIFLMPGARAGYDRSDKVRNNISFSISKSILKNKGNITFRASDIFAGSSVSKTSILMPGLNSVVVEDRNFRVFTLSFGYRFGSDKVKQVRNREVGIEEEASRSTNQAQ